MNKRLQKLLPVVLLGFLFTQASLFGQNNTPASKAQTIEDFETGDFSQFDWQFSGSADWMISENNPYEGSYSARSGIITHSQSTSLTLNYEVYAADTLSFRFRVSSESGFDFLKFFIDGILKDSWSGQFDWSQASYIVDAGVHTFTWQYEKDFSVSSGEDACWIDYIIFPPEEVEAAFSADTTVVCSGEFIQFTDQSIGPVNEWNWTFEGGNPITSNLQNPLVEYTAMGSYDVFLEVSDGIESSELYMPEYITVGESPQNANTPTGISYLCASWGNTTYNTASLPGVSTYNWILEPDGAGEVTGTGTSVTVSWVPDFLGTASLKVAGENFCGIGNYSNPLNITRYLPNVTCVLPAYVGLPEPPFILTGGSPPGGQYIGDGVSNGMFDAMTAGLGPHTITYTYTDLNLCSNSAQDVITVTQFIGINQQEHTPGFSVDPNPGQGLFTLHFNNVNEMPVQVGVYNLFGKLVHQAVINLTDIESGHVLNLTNLPGGIYFVRVTGNKQDMTKKILITDGH